MYEILRLIWRLYYFQFLSMIATLLVGVHSAHLPVATIPSSGGQPRIAKQVSILLIIFHGKCSKKGGQFYKVNK
jgi:hypothetical protein